MASITCSLFLSRQAPDGHRSQRRRRCFFRVAVCRHAVLVHVSDRRSAAIPRSLFLLHQVPALHFEQIEMEHHGPERAHEARYAVIFALHIGD